MSAFLNVLHPSFESLSALADQGELDGARTRVGRHVARCAVCRSAVEELRALGAEARDDQSTPAMSADLWSRIEAGVRASADEPARRETPPVVDPQWEVAPALQPTRLWPVPAKRRALALLGGLAAAAAALIAVSLATSRAKDAYALEPARLTATPFRPAPGSIVRIRFAPPVKMAGLQRAMLAGRYVKGTISEAQDFYFDGGFDSLATLTRGADGALVGEFKAPADFEAVFLVVSDPITGEAVTDNNLSSWMVVGGDAKGRPALGSLLAAASSTGFYGSRSAAQVADTLQRYFPDHPAGFAEARKYRGQGIFADLVKFFESAERKYSSFDSRLWPQSKLDAEREVAMIAFARRIEEPAEAKKWTRRFARDHPSDPRALTLWASMIHAIELTEPPIDSIKPYLPMLDELYEKNGHVIDRWNQGLEMVERYGDAAMKRRWVLRSLASGHIGHGVAVTNERLLDPEIRAAARSAERIAIAKPCGNPLHVVPPRLRLNWVARQCAGLRASAYAELSWIALYDRDLRLARLLADSSMAIQNTWDDCRKFTSRRVLGEVLLAQGDTMGAARAFARTMYSYPEWRALAAGDSLARRLSVNVDSSRWAALAAEAGTEYQTCQQRVTARFKAQKAEEK